MANIIQQSVNKIWEDYDTSKDGRLSFEESRDFIESCFGGNLKLKNEDLKKVFDKIDTNKNGYLDRNEMSVFLVKLLSLSEKK